MVKQSAVSRTASWRGAACAVLAMCFVVASASAVDVEVTVTNLAPTDGLFLTPMWIGFHDGSATFDLFDIGSPIAAGGGLEILAEEGDTSVLSGEFGTATSGSGGIDTTIIAPGGFGGPPVFDPGESASSGTFNLDPVNNRYMSYASMVIPSNDAFIGNSDPTAVELFDSAGNFNGPFSFIVLGERVYDAGTEENTEMDAAFINQANTGDGVVTNDPVALHVGFIGSAGNPVGTPIILGGTTAAGTTLDTMLADFTQSGHQIAEFSITPEPSSVLMIGK